MPIPVATKNTISTQLDTLFDAIVAGTAFTNLTWIHNGFTFATGGRTYAVMVVPAGDAQNASIVLRIKRKPL